MTAPDDEIHRRIRREVHARRVFYQHLVVYAAVMALLLMINLSAGSLWWVQWPAMGWGLLLVLHGAFAAGGLLGPRWEEERIAALMRDRTPR